jgi:hypothetical protein
MVIEHANLLKFSENKHREKHLSTIGITEKN